MKNLQEKRWLKGIAWLLVVVCAFGFAYTAGLGLSIYGYHVGYDQGYENQILYYQTLAWQEFDLMQNPGETAQEQLAGLEEELQNSGFYFEIRNEATDEVLLSNLTDDSQKDILEYFMTGEATSTEVEYEESEPITTTDTDYLYSVTNPICFYEADGVLNPVYTYAASRRAKEIGFPLYVLCDSDMLHRVRDITLENGVYTVSYSSLSDSMDPYSYAIKMTSQDSVCYVLLATEDFLQTSITEENRDTILEAIESQSVYVKVGESYYQIIQFEVDDDGNDCLAYYLDYDEFLEPLDRGVIAADTSAEETNEELEETSDLTAVYFRLLSDGVTLRALNLYQTEELEEALEEGSLYVVTGEGELCPVRIRESGGSCTYAPGGAIHAELVWETRTMAPDSLEISQESGAVCYERMEDGTLTALDTNDATTIFGLFYNERLYVLSEEGIPSLVTSCIQENGLYQLEYAVYTGGMVLTGSDESQEETSAEEVEEETVEAPAASYYMAYGIASVEGTTTFFDEWEEQSARMQGILPTIIAISVTFGVVDLLAVVWLCIASGHRKGKEGITLNRFDRIWLDLLLVCYFIAFCWVMAIGVGIIRFNWGNLVRLGFAAAYCTVVEVGLLWLLLTVLTRLKAGTIWKNLLIMRIFRKLRISSRLRKVWDMMQRNLNLAVKVGLVYGVFMLLNFFCAASYGISITVFFLWLLLHLIVLSVLESWCLSFHSIRKGVTRLNQGEMEASIDTTGMPYDLKAVAEQLNNLSEGINRAVEKQMQSERFKSELITNVSHDLKTPLTSIINYIDLLKQTDITDPKALEYLEVLDRKSQRLKKLTEDLVEASKASTGAIKVEKTVLDFSQLVTQALGEYDEKLQSARLETVYQQPEEPMLVMGDGRHLWRVLDNLLSNCVKYAMPETRVYLSLSQEEDSVTLEMKNISAEPLNLTVEELMERFVRGDSSRSTEGSGLGLNIAMNLTEL